MKNDQMMFVLFCNDAPLAIYRALTKQQQDQILTDCRASELRIAQQRYGIEPASPNHKARHENDIKTHLNTHYYHFHEVRFKVAKPTPPRKAQEVKQAA